MRKKINIHSISSVITNSSEMIYVVDDGKTEEQILEILQPYIKMDKEAGNYSGNGGCVECFFADPADYYPCEDVPTEMFLEVDWAFKNTIEAVNKLFGYKKDE